VTRENQSPFLFVFSEKHFSNKSIQLKASTRITVTKSMNESSNSTPSSSMTSASLIMRVRDQSQEAWSELVKLYAPLVNRWCLRKGVNETDAADVTQEIFLSVANSLDRFQCSDASRQQPGSFRAWLWTIARRRIADWYRRQDARQGAVGGSSNLRRCQAQMDPHDESISVDIQSSGRMDGKSDGFLDEPFDEPFDGKFAGKSESQPSSQPSSKSESPLENRFDDEPSLATDLISLQRRAMQQIESKVAPQTWRAFWRCVVDGQSTQQVADELGLSIASVRQARSRILRRLREQLGDC